ncbi:MAG: hypothetical protein ACRDHW_00155 [Ktedonobacteraceae bacterium]
MAKTYTLTEVAEALEVDPKSLRRWIEIEAWDLSKQTTVYDKRIKYLTEEQVAKLAKAHERLWPPRPRPVSEQAQAAGLAGGVNMLREQVADLQADHISITQFSATVKQLQDQIDELERKYGELLQQNTAILLQLAEYQQATPKKPGRKPKASPAADTPEYQAGLQAVDQGDD